MARSPAPRRRPRPARPDTRAWVRLLVWWQFPRALGAGPHRHARTRRRQRGGRGCSYAYRATTCPRPGSTRPRPGRPRPARPQPAPGLEHRPPAPGGRQGASTHGPHRQSHARPPSPPLHRRVRHAQLPSRRGRRPAIRNQLHRPQAHLISDPHPTRHIDHSSEPVMVQPPPDTTQFQPSFSSAKCTSRRQSAHLECKVHISATRPVRPGDVGDVGAVGGGRRRAPAPTLTRPRAPPTRSAGPGGPAPRPPAPSPCAGPAGSGRPRPPPARVPPRARP